jgi:hypothetical protein
MLKRFFARFFAGLFVLVSLLIPVAVHAATSIFTETLVYDDFDTVESRPAEGAYWYLINWTDFGPVLGNYGDSTSLTAEAEDGVTYASLANHPDATPGNYASAELAERYFLADPPEEANWSPTPGHPIVYEVRARWSEVYVNGSAVGTSGFWLWNSPVTPFELLPTKSFGFIWSQEGTAFNMSGLNATVIRGPKVPVPVYSKPVTGIDITDWNTYKVVWSAGPGTNETLTFYVNDVEIGSHITRPLGSLSVEVWNDNQQSTTTGTTYHNPPTTQAMDIDYLRVERQ